MRRLAGLLLLAGAAWTGEADPTPAPPVPVVRFTATGMSMSLSPDRPSEATGMRLEYEAVVLASDRLAYRLTPFPGARRAVLSSADLNGGPDGRVLFDSSRSQLPQVSFRGVLRPTALTIRRLDADPAQPETVRFRAEASELGDVLGAIETPGGTRLHVAWAEQAVLEFAGTVDAGAAMGMAAPRLTALHFYGRAQPFRLATVLRLRQGAPAEPAQVEPRLAARDYGMRVSGRVISLRFSDLGALQTIDGVEESEILDGEDLIPMRAAGKPVLGK